MLGHKLSDQFNSQGLNVEILSGFDDVALMRAFGVTHDIIFVTSSLHVNDSYNDDSVVEIDHARDAMGEHHAIFAERMIQHPAVQCVCNIDYSALFTPVPK